MDILDVDPSLPRIKRSTSQHNQKNFAFNRKNLNGNALLGKNNTRLIANGEKVKGFNQKLKEAPPRTQDNIATVRNYNKSQQKLQKQSGTGSNSSQPEVWRNPKTNYQEVNRLEIPTEGEFFKFRTKDAGEISKIQPRLKKKYKKKDQTYGSKENGKFEPKAYFEGEDLVLILDAIKTAVLIELLYGDDDVEEEEEEEEELPCVNRKYENLELQYQDILSQSSIDLIKSGKFNHCDLLDYEQLNDPNVVMTIHNQLKSLIGQYGIRYDAVLAYSSTQAEKELGENINIRGTYMVSQPIARFRNKRFDMILAINVDLLSNTLANINAHLKQQASPKTPNPNYRYGRKRVAFTYESVEDLITHDYAHLLTMPVRTSKLIDWLDRMNDKVIKDNKEEYTFLLEDRVQNHNDISEYAADEGGAEMLAEIFTRFHKNMLVTPEWAITFNQEIQKNFDRGVKGKIHKLDGDF